MNERIRHWSEWGETLLTTASIDPLSPALARCRETLAQVAADQREAEKGHTPCGHGHYFYCGFCGPEPFLKATNTTSPRKP